MFSVSFLIFWLFDPSLLEVSTQCVDDGVIYAMVILGHFAFLSFRSNKRRIMFLCTIKTVY